MISQKWGMERMSTFRSRDFWKHPYFRRGLVTSQQVTPGKLSIFWVSGKSWKIGNDLMSLVRCHLTQADPGLYGNTRVVCNPSKLICSTKLWRWNLIGCYLMVSFRYLFHPLSNFDSPNEILHHTSWNWLTSTKRILTWVVSSMFLVRVAGGQ